MSIKDNVINLKLQLSSDEFQAEVARTSLSLGQVSKAADDAWKAFKNADKAADGTKVLQAAVKDLNSYIDEGYKQIAEYSKQIEVLSKDLDEDFNITEAAAEKIAILNQKITEIESGISGARDELSKFNDALNGSSKYTAQLTAPLTSLQNQFTKAGDAMQNYTGKSTALNLVTSGMGKFIGDLGTPLEWATKTITSMGDSFTKVTDGAKKFLDPAKMLESVTKLASKGFDLLKEGVENAAESFLHIDKVIGSTTTTLSNTLSDGAEGAQKYIDRIKETPASMEAMAEGGKALAGVMVDANGKAFSADKLYDYTKALEDTSVGLGGTSSDVESLAKALGEMSSKTTLQAQQFNMMVNNNSAFAKSLKDTIIAQSDGKITAETWAEEMKNGAISSEMVNTAIMTLGKTYEGQSTKVTNWSQLMDNAKKTLEVGSYEAFSESLKKMGVNVDDVSKNFTNWSEGAMKEIPSVVDGVAKAIEGVIKYFEKFAPVIEPLIPQIQKFIDSFSKGFSEIWKAVSPVIDQLMSLLVPIIEKVIEMFLKIAADTMPVLVAAFNSVMPIVSNVISILKNLWDSIQPLIPIIISIAELIISRFIGAFTATVGIVGTVIGILGDLASTLIGALVNAFKIISNSVDFFVKLISGDFTGAGKAAERVVQSLADFVSGIGGGIFDAIKNAANNLWSTVKGVFDNITNAIGGVLKAIGNVIGSATGASKAVSDIKAPSSKASKNLDVLGAGVRSVGQGGFTTATSDTTQPAQTQTTINITGSKVDARAIADELKRRGLL